MRDLVGPVAVKERISSLDVLRGVAVCGILLMNITMMGLIGEVSRPPLPAILDIDWIAYTIQDLIFAGSMRGLFTLLFGAGMLIMLRRADSPNGDASMQAYFTRCFALMLLGVANFTLFLWPGEILFNYGVAGLALVLFRKAKTRVLLAAAAAILILMSVALGSPGIDRAESLRGVPAAAAAKEAGKTLTKAQEGSLAMQESMNEVLNPTAEKIEKERAQRTSLPGVLVWSTKLWVDFNFGNQAIIFLGESLGFMLIGMALFQRGILSGEKSLRFYVLLAVGGYSLGFLVRGAFLSAEWSTGFLPNPDQMLWRGFIYELGRLPTTIGLLGLVMVVLMTGALGRLAVPIQAIGRMALTNYVGQSLITAIIFYAFGLVGKFGFAQLMGIAALIWIFQAIFSVFWLKRYEMGPLEWMLRMLTYGEVTPLQRVQPSITSPELSIR